MNERPEWWTSDEWSTPQPVFDLIAGRWGPFTLDPCARPETAKTENFYTKADDGLSKEWTGSIFVNPPYSDVTPWVMKAIEAKAAGHKVVMLLPAATDTDWFHDCVLAHANLIDFLRRRVRFVGWQGTSITNPRAPSLVAVFDGQRAA